MTDRRHHSPAALISAAVVGLVLVACVSSASQQTETAVDGTPPVEQLSNEVLERSISVDEAVERLRKLRATAGANVPARYHLAAARVNLYEGHPGAALEALEAAVETDDAAVSDSEQRQLAESILRTALAADEDKETRLAARLHLASVEPRHPQLRDVAIAAHRLERLRDLLDGPVIPTDRTLRRAQRLCDEGLQSAQYLDDFSVICARVAHHLDEPARARSILEQWLDGYDDRLDRLDAIVFGLHFVSFVSDDTVAVLQEYLPEALAWRTDLGAFLVARGRTTFESLQHPEIDAFPSEAGVEILRAGAEYAYLRGDTELAHSHLRWWEQFDDDSDIDGTLVVGPVAHRFGDTDLLESLMESELGASKDRISSSDAGDDQRLDELSASPDELPTELVFFLNHCREFEHVASDRLVTHFILAHNPEYDELVETYCPRLDDLADHRDELVKNRLESIRYALRYSDDRQLARATVEWLADNPWRVERLVDHCRTDHCPPPVAPIVESAREPGDDSSHRRLPPNWRTPPPLGEIRAVAADPTGDQYVTFHAGDRTRVADFYEVEFAEVPDYRRGLEPRLVIRNHATGEEHSRFELPLRREFLEPLHRPGTGPPYLDWDGRRAVLVTAMDEEAALLVVDTETGEIARHLLDSDRLGPVLDGNEIVSAGPAYRHGPVEITRRTVEPRPLVDPSIDTYPDWHEGWKDARQSRLDELPVTTQRRIWSHRDFSDWDRLLSDGTLVDVAGDKLAVVRPDGREFEMSISGAEITILRGGPEGRYLYAVAENVYAIDLDDETVHTAFGVCDGGPADTGPTLDERTVPDGTLLECDSPLARPANDGGNTAVTFVADRDGPLPWIPHLQSDDRMTDLDTGASLKLECPAADVHSAHGSGGLDSLPENCGLDNLCDHKTVTTLHGSVVPAPRALVELPTGSYDDSPVFVLISGLENPSYRFVGPRAAPTSFDFSPEGNQLLIGSFTPYRGLTVRDAATGQFEFHRPASFVTDAGFSQSPSSILAVTAPPDDRQPESFVAQWPLDSPATAKCGPGSDVATETTGELLAPAYPERPDDQPTDLQTDIDPESGLAALVTGPQQIRLYDGRDGGRFLDRIDVADDRRVETVAWLSDGRLGALLGPDDPRLPVSRSASAHTRAGSLGGLVFFESDDNTDWRETRRLDLELESRPVGMARLTDEFLVVAKDRDARIVSTDDGATVALLDGLSEDVTALATSPDGERVAIGTADGQTTVWRVNLEE